MKGLRAFLCRHPYLAMLLPLIPAVAITAMLVAMKVIDPSFAMILLAWAFFFISLPIRRIPRDVMREAQTALERDLDPDAYLAGLELLRARHPKNPIAVISLGANYAAGLDAKGESEAALSQLRALLDRRAALDPLNRIQFDLSYAVVAVHTESGRAEVPSLLGAIERSLPTLPPAFAAAVRETLDNVRMAYALAVGGEEDATVIAYYVKAVTRSRAEGEMSRRRLVRSCMNLARAYDRAGRTRDAYAMYRYVAENGGGLGVSAEAKRLLAARSSLSKTDTAGENR